MTYQHDLAGRQTRITWPDAFYAAYEYDVVGALIALRENSRCVVAVTSRTISLRSRSRTGPLRTYEPLKDLAKMLAIASRFLRASSVPRSLWRTFTA